MELMGKAQQDGGQWMSDKAEMRATLTDRDAEIASLRNTVIELQNTRGDTSKSHGLSHEEAQKLATSFENSQQQIRLLSAQKTELLERVIQLTSQQAPLQTPQMQSPDLPPPPPPPDYDDHDDMGAEASDLHVSTDDEEGAMESDSSASSEEAAILAGVKVWASSPEGQKF